MTDMIAADYGIRQLHARFVDAVWRQDAEAFAACWSEDGLWKIAGMEVQGRAALVDACRQLLGRCKRIHLLCGPAMLKPEGSGVIGRLNITEFATMNDGSTAMTIGWYHDRYVEESGQWRFALRHWSFKYRGPPDLTGTYIDTPDYGAFPAFPAADEPTFVRKG
ncbi:nuclear transport factor 2 family protein [Sphingomonas sp. 35-24ZXX]|uniref:nuclear transport factor 2 family protein n=1 Tax=Sphingomonas sp. 35-24ZXX TaxID=1545915 RepID=UPI00053BDC92|nr:nuclear transport factor 2 family protein [Sphingomonas sp. 35-24ZXX]